MPVQGSLPSQAAQVGDDTKLNIWIKPQTIFSLVPSKTRQLPLWAPKYLSLVSAAADSHHCCWRRKIPRLGYENPFNSNTAVVFCCALQLLSLHPARVLWRKTPNNGEKAAEFPTIGIYCVWVVWFFFFFAVIPDLSCMQPRGSGGLFFLLNLVLTLWNPDPNAWVWIWWAMGRFSFPHPGRAALCNSGTVWGSFPLITL